MPPPSESAGSDEGRIGRRLAPAATTAPAEEGPTDAGGGERVDLADGRGLEELADLPGGGGAAQRLLDPLHDEEEGDQEGREEDDAQRDHAVHLLVLPCSGPPCPPSAIVPRTVVVSRAAYARPRVRPRSDAGLRAPGTSPPAHR